MICLGISCASYELYRLIIHNKSEADELGTIAVRDDAVACEFGTKLVRDVIRDAPSKHLGWTLEIAAGERTIATIPFNLDAPDEDEIAVAARRPPNHSSIGRRC